MLSQQLQWIDSHLTAFSLTFSPKRHFYLYFMMHVMPRCYCGSTSGCAYDAIWSLSAVTHSMAPPFSCPKPLFAGWFGKRRYREKHSFIVCILQRNGAESNLLAHLWAQDCRCSLRDSRLTNRNPHVLWFYLYFILKTWWCFMQVQKCYCWWCRFVLIKIYYILLSL